MNVAIIFAPILLWSEEQDQVLKPIKSKTNSKIFEGIGDDAWSRKRWMFLIHFIENSY